MPQSVSGIRSSGRDIIPVGYILIAVIAAAFGGASGIRMAAGYSEASDAVHGLVMTGFVVLPALFGGFGGLFLPRSLSRHLPVRMPCAPLNAAGWVCFLLSAVLFEFFPQFPLSAALSWCGGALAMAMVIMIAILDSRAGSREGVRPLDFFAWSQLFAGFALLLTLPVAAARLVRFALAGPITGVAVQDIMASLVIPMTPALLMAAFGIAALAMERVSGPRIAVGRWMALCTGVALLVSVLPWMRVFTRSGEGFSEQTILMAGHAGTAISVVTGLVFACFWGRELWRGKLSLRPSVLWSFGLLMTVAAGGLMVVLGSGCLHGAVMSGLLFALFAGLYLRSEEMGWPNPSRVMVGGHFALVAAGTLSCAMGGVFLPVGAVLFLLSVPAAVGVLLSIRYQMRFSAPVHVDDRVSG
ncbi:MAG: hypothetical protein SOH81_01820 [Acetobacter sp.]|jgi:hypothetical protein